MLPENGGKGASAYSTTAGHTLIGGAWLVTTFGLAQDAKHSSRNSAIHTLALGDGDLWGLFRIDQLPFGLYQSAFYVGVAAITVGNLLLRFGIQAGHFRQRGLLRLVGYGGGVKAGLQALVLLHGGDGPGDTRCKQGE